MSSSGGVSVPRIEGNHLFCLTPCQNIQTNQLSFMLDLMKCMRRWENKRAAWDRLKFLSFFVSFAEGMRRFEVFFFFTSKVPNKIRQRCQWSENDPSSLCTLTSSCSSYFFSPAYDFHLYLLLFVFTVLFLVIVALFLATFFIDFYLLWHLALLLSSSSDDYLHLLPLCSLLLIAVFSSSSSFPSCSSLFSSTSSSCHHLAFLFNLSLLLFHCLHLFRSSSLIFICFLYLFIYIDLPFVIFRLPLPCLLPRLFLTLSSSTFSLLSSSSLSF